MLFPVYFSICHCFILLFFITPIPVKYFKQSTCYVNTCLGSYEQAVILRAKMQKKGAGASSKGFFVKKTMKF